METKEAGVSEALGVEGTDSLLTKPVSRVRVEPPWPEPFMTSFFDEPFPIRNMDFQFGAPGEVGEVGPLGGDRVPSGEAVGPFLSDAVAGMVGSGGVLGAERERGRRRRRRGRELRASVVVESKGQGSK